MTGSDMRPAAQSTRAARRDMQPDLAVTAHEEPGVRERQVNDALRMLDEMHRLGRIERDEYRQRRRRLLESLGGEAPSDDRDTVRRRVPARDTRREPVPFRRRDAGSTRMPRMRGRRVALWMLLLVVVVGALAAGWLMLAS
ncbi:hypothetical protein [Burkholderia sp. WSM2232]|uniref:hypothetical protein n=1 Tax=Burkholderia sp. WSM2232 TaxID=944436 RepID=UPI0003F5A3D2|nr:hypothetical protein [Burkholderia sp. WSM2232]